MIIIDILNKKMSLNEQCKQIRELQSTNEDLAFEQLGEVLRDYMKDYSCDNVFYLHYVDSEDDYNTFREKTEIIFGLLYDIFYDEEQINEVSNDPSIKDELTKYWKLIESLQFIKKHIRNIDFKQEDSVEVRCFHTYINYCKTYLEDMYNGIEELNNTMDELNDSLGKLTEKLSTLANA